MAERQHTEHPGVYETPPGSGIYTISYVDERGRRHRQTVGPLGLAIRVRQQQVARVRDQRHFPRRERITVADAIGRYLEGAGAGKRSWRDDRNFAALWTAELGDRWLEDVAPGDVERVRNRWAGELAANTVNHRLSFLRRVYSVAIRDEMADKNPVSRVDFLRDPTAGALRYLTDEEEVRLRAAFPPRWWHVVQLAILTGLRMAEQFGLRWEDVDLASGLITIPRSKSGKLRRVPIHQQARAILERLAEGRSIAWVFVGDHGARLDGHNFYGRVFRPALVAAGLGDVRAEAKPGGRRRNATNWHTLRHTCASRLVMAGVDLRTVMEIMGHATLTVTQRYAHLSPQHVASAIGAIRLAPDAPESAPPDEPKS